MKKNSRKQEGYLNETHKNGTKRASEAKVIKISGYRERKRNANQAEEDWKMKKRGGGCK